MKSIQVVLLLFFAGTAFASTLRNQAVLSLGTQRDGCKDNVWSHPTSPVSQLIWWCFNGAGCGSSRMDYVYITVKSAKFLQTCRRESDKDDMNRKRDQYSIAPLLLGSRQDSPDVRTIMWDAFNRAGDYTPAFPYGGDCYCYAGSWDGDNDAEVYVTVVSNNRNTVTLKVENVQWTDSEMINDGTSFTILKKSCSSGNWERNICSSNYPRLTAKTRNGQRMSWSDFGDEIAWIGDRDKNRGGIRFVN